MPDLHDIHIDPEWDDAEQVRLSLAWNALLHGQADAIDALDSKDAAVIEHLETLARGSTPHRAFTHELKEQLMDTSVPLPFDGKVHRQTAFVTPLSDAKRSSTRGRRWWNNSRHALGAVATIALVVVSLFGGYLAISSSGGGGEQEHGLSGFVTKGTPGASPVACDNCEAYSPSASGVEVMGNGFINLRDLSDAQRAATKVQMQDWVIDPMITIGQSGQAMGDIQGVTVDIVIDGAAVATMHGPTTLVKRDHPAYTSSQSIFNLQSGDKVALGPGDLISYPAGDAPTVLNPLPMTPLHIKRTVFYSGEVAPSNPTNMLPDGVHTKVDGEGTLPRALVEYGESDVTVELDYVHFYEGEELPQHRYGTLWDRALGPIAPVSAESRGYVLWVGTPLG